MAEKRKVKCNGCGNEWESQAEPENIKCQKCGGVDITDTATTPEAPKADPPPPPPPPPPVKGQQQLEAEADVARRKAVDLANAKAAEKVAAEQERLAKIPLTADEKKFVAEIGARMNDGRRTTMPTSAEILKFSRLKARMEGQKGGK